MSRENPRQHVTPAEERHDVIDFAADYGMDAVEFGGMDPEIVASGLAQAAEEIRQRGHEVDQDGEN